MLMHITTGRLHNLARIRGGGGGDADPAPVARLQPASAAGGAAAAGAGEAVIDRVMLRKLLDDDLRPSKLIKHLGDYYGIRDEGVAALGAAAESFLADVFRLAGKVVLRVRCAGSGAPQQQHQ